MGDMAPQAVQGNTGSRDNEKLIDASSHVLQIKEIPTLPTATAAPTPTSYAEWSKVIAARGNERKTAMGPPAAAEYAENGEVAIRVADLPLPPPPQPQQQQQQHMGEGDADWSEPGSENRGGDSFGRNSDNRFSSWTSLGSVTQERPARARATGLPSWGESLVMGGRCCCNCAPLTRGLRGSTGGTATGQPGSPETFRDEQEQDDGSASDHQRQQSQQSAAEGSTGKADKTGYRPRHRRGHSAGTARIMVQPQGWEIGGGGSCSGSGGSFTTVASSTATSSNASSGASASLAAAASLGDAGGREPTPPWGRRSGSWGAGSGAAFADREFHRILKAGVDVYKHSSTPESGQWVDVIPRRIKELLSRRCPMEDQSQGLVTLFFDKARENLCWCSPGEAELVPDERYCLSVRSLTEVVRGDKLHPRLLSLRTSGRENPLVFELDSDDIYHTLATGIARILERNHMRDTCMAKPRDVVAI